MHTGIRINPQPAMCTLCLLVSRFFTGTYFLKMVFGPSVQSSIVDPDPVGSSSFSRIWIRPQIKTLESY